MEKSLFYLMLLVITIETLALFLILPGNKIDVYRKIEAKSCFIGEGLESYNINKVGNLVFLDGKSIIQCDNTENNLVQCLETEKGTTEWDVKCKKYQWRNEILVPEIKE